MTTRTLRGPRRRWRGTSLALTASLMPALVGFVALSVDTAVIATSRAQLKTTADAAALAGAMRLVSENRVRGATDLSTEIAAAQSQAKSTAQANKVLGLNAVILDNPANSASGDVALGYFNPANKTWSAPPLADIRLMNSAQVTASRSANHAGVVPSSFSKIFHSTGTNVAVKSIATAQNYKIGGFYGNGSTGVNLLPIVLDKATYEAMLAGTTTDQYAFNPSTKAVTAGPDGVEESKLYPVASGNPGNWGTVNIGVNNNSTSTLGDQIRNGISPSQLATFPNARIELNTALSPPSIQFAGNPGISTGIKDDLASIIGKPVTIPIYDQTGGNGNNAWYRVIAFAGVRLLSVNFQGNPKYVIIQPALIRDHSAIPSTPFTSWTSGGLVRIHLSD